jgi:hypothetical protein
MQNSSFTLKNKNNFKTFQNLAYEYNRVLKTVEIDYSMSAVINNITINVYSINVDDPQAFKTVCFEMREVLDAIPDGIKSRYLKLDEISKRVSIYMENCVSKL